MGQLLAYYLPAETLSTMPELIFLSTKLNYFWPHKNLESEQLTLVQQLEEEVY